MNNECRIANAELRSEKNNAIEKAIEVLRVFVLPYQRLIENGYGVDMWGSDEAMMGGYKASDFRQAEHAIAELEQLRFDINHHWIPITERLPEHGQEVQVFAINSYCYCRRFKTKSGIGSNGIEGFHNIGGTAIMPIKNVTHWKPIILPETSVAKDEVNDDNE